MERLDNDLVEMPGMAPPAAAARGVIHLKFKTEGAKLLDEVEAFLNRFVRYPSVHACAAHALWIVHAHAMDAWDSTPRLAFLSAEPASGKTRGLEVTRPLVPNAVEAVNVSAAYLFRKVGDDNGRPTILFDEIDTVFGPKAKENEDIRGLLNAGHRKGAVAGRCVVVGNRVKTEEIPAYSAVAVAGLGDLPDTILTRAIVLRMRRRAPDEQVEPWRQRIHEKEGEAIRDRLAAWALKEFTRPIDVWPVMPDGVADRDADVWEPLLAIADKVGGKWPEVARKAAVALVRESKDTSPSLGVRLLGDMRAIFADADGAGELATEVILPKLHEIVEAPWGDIRGKPLSDRGLARQLRKYGIKPRVLSDKTRRGYLRADFSDAWKRYLPRHSPAQASEPSQPSDNAL